MYKFLFSFILVLLFCGCASAYGNKDRFIRYRDYDVGRSVDLSYATPSKILPYNETQDKYLFEAKGGCEWAYYVNKETKIVESWEYVSSPDKCSTKVSWFGGSPW